MRLLRALMFGRTPKPKILYRSSTLYEVVWDDAICMVSCEMMADGKSMHLFKGQTRALSDCSDDQVEGAISLLRNEMEKGGIEIVVRDE